MSPQRTPPTDAAAPPAAAPALRAPDPGAGPAARRARGPVAAPGTVEEVLQRVAEVSEGLPRRLRQCADFVCAFPGRIAVSTVADLAAGAEVPPSAVIRFCQMLGFSGFSEFQRLFRDAHGIGRPDYATRLRNLREAGPDGPVALLADFVDAGRRSLEALAESVDAAALEHATGLLAQADTLHVAGFRRAFAVAAYLGYILGKMEVPAILHDQAGQLDRRFALRPGDALLAITFAPYSAETLALVQDARDRGLPVVLMTDRPTSPAARLADAVLIVPEVDYGAFRSLSATLVLALAVAVAVGTARGSVARPG